MKVLTARTWPKKASWYALGANLERHPGAIRPRPGAIRKRLSPSWGTPGCPYYRTIAIAPQAHRKRWALFGIFAPSWLILAPSWPHMEGQARTEKRPQGSDVTNKRLLACFCVFFACSLVCLLVCLFSCLFVCLLACLFVCLRPKMFPKW